MNSTILKTYLKINLNNLPMNPPALVRQANIGAIRQRLGSEQYSRVTSESGDILLIDYTRDCRTVLKLKKGTLYPHAFYNPVYYGDKTELKLQVVDLATGDILPDWELNGLSELMQKPGCICYGSLTIISPMEGDLGIHPSDVTLNHIGI
jgi:hypothetical protein